MATATVATKHGDVIPGVPNQLGWAIWPLWVAACAVGNALGAVAGPSAGPGAFLVAATLPGFLQWLIFRRYFSGAGWWFLATGVGSLLGFLTIPWWVAVADTQPGAYGGMAVPAIIVLGGTILGAVEWLVLRRWTALSGLWVFVGWVLARSIGWFGATWVFMSLSDAAGAPTWGGSFLGGAASGALSGAITGLALGWLLHYPKTTEASGSAAV